MYICNAFSLQMLPKGLACDVRVEPVTTEYVKTVGLTSAIGHQDTTNVVNNLLGTQLNPERVNLELTTGDMIIVAQVQGGRLPEGCTVLPEGTSISFLKVSVLLAF